uniref:Uncharacterized protein n=1 Tax=Rhizophora mucronata TaxID=61149 RepID=A0A2P2Q1S9_RHIMU
MYRNIQWNLKYSSGQLSTPWSHRMRIAL